MKKMIFAAATVSMFISAVLFANVPFAKKHKKLKGLDGAKVNCAYCHKSNKANMPKKKGNDLVELRKGKFCAMKGCH